MLNVTLDLSPVVHHKAGLATYAQNLGEALIEARIDDLSLGAFNYGSATARELTPPLAALPRTQLAWGARRWRLTVALRTFARMWMDDAVATHPHPLPGRERRHTAVFHATEHLLPPMQHARSVFTFHDAIYALYPQFHLRMNLWFLNLMMPRFLARANRVIAVSERSARDCMRLYGVLESKITVVYEAADASWRPISNTAALAEVRAKYGLPDQFMLCLGTIEPRKNIGVLLDALKAMLASDATAALVIAGRKGWLFEPIFAQVRELGLDAHVIFTGYVPADDARALMNAATLFAYPSLYEGFGLPPLEAMACGTPVVCSNASSLPEVVGDAALTVPPTDARALASALQRVWRDADLRADLRARGLARAARFSWARAARETADVYREAAR